MANFANNMWQILRNKCTSLLQNPDSLKAESLILASLALVISRICISTASAIKAQGTPEGPYRYRESIRTDIREVCGFTFGFVVLRQIQGRIVKPILRHVLGVSESRDPNAYSLSTGMKELLKGDVKPFTPHLEQGIVMDWHTSQFSNWLTAKGPVQSLIRKTYGNLEHDAKKKFILNLYKGGGIFLASVPTVALAGYALERFTRDHSDQVVDAVSNFFSRSAHKVQEEAGKVQGQLRQHAATLGPPQGMGVQGNRHPVTPFVPFMQPVWRPMPRQAPMGFQAQPLPAVAPHFEGHRPAVKPMAAPRLSSGNGRFAV